MENFPKKKSFKSLIYRSLRISKNSKASEYQSDTSVFVIEQITHDNIEFLKPIRQEMQMPMFPIMQKGIQPCSLVQLYVGTVLKTYDNECRMTSFGRKHRSHKVFGAGLRVNEQLCCPEQARQIEIHFTSSFSSDVILQVQAPNGELSNYLYTIRERSVFFNPTKIGCGHGTWLVNIAVRIGCRFRHIRTEKLQLKGQGIVVYNIEPNATIRLAEKLWLDWQK